MPEVGGGTGKVSFCFASSSDVAPFANAIIFPSGDHCGLPAPRGRVVNCHASPPSSEIMNNCGDSGRPSFSGTRTKARCVPSGDQRGEVSRVPPVSCFVSPFAVETIQIAVLYPSFRSLTVTFTNATRDPSGDTCGSAIQLKLNRSLSVMFRFCPRAGQTTNTIVTQRKTRRRRIDEFPSEEKL